MVKQREFCTNTLMIASGLPRLSSRHHCVSGSTTASTPIGLAQTGICAVALVCMLRPELGRVLLVWAAAGVDRMTSAAEAASAEASLRIDTPLLITRP